MVCALMVLTGMQISRGVGSIYVIPRDFSKLCLFSCLVQYFLAFKLYYHCHVGGSFGTNIWYRPYSIVIVASAIEFLHGLLGSVLSGSWALCSL